MYECKQHENCTTDGCQFFCWCPSSTENHPCVDIDCTASFPLFRKLFGEIHVLYIYFSMLIRQEQTECIPLFQLSIEKLYYRTWQVSGGTPFMKLASRTSEGSRQWIRTNVLSACFTREIKYFNISTLSSRNLSALYFNYFFKISNCDPQVMLPALYRPGGTFQMMKELHV